MKPIKVPNVPASAYDRNRPASDLLKRQVDQLQHVLSAVASTGNRVTDMKAAAKRVKTEGQASAFMLKAMLALHPEGSTRPLAKPLRGSPKPGSPKQSGSIAKATAKAGTTKSSKKK